MLEGALDRQELPDGYAVSLPNDDETMLSVARWSVDERRCCPFFTFTIVREPPPGPLWLRITGPEGAKQILEEAFPK
jgi:hypothetical protein